jgi:glutamine synthetase
MLAAGLAGIEHEYPLPEPTEENVFEMGDEERRRRGIELLPDSLREAILVAEESALVRECLGGHVVESLLKNKKIEWAEYRAHVSDFERQRYLPVL